MYIWLICTVFVQPASTLIIVNHNPISIASFGRDFRGTHSQFIFSAVWSLSCNNILGKILLLYSELTFVFHLSRRTELVNMIIRFRQCSIRVLLLCIWGGFWPRTTRSWWKVRSLPFPASSTLWWSWRNVAITVISSDLRKPVRRWTKVDLRLS